MAVPGLLQNYIMAVPSCFALPVFFLVLQFLFKKYLEYEKSLGEEERIEYVKQKAMEYVESTVA